MSDVKGVDTAGKPTFSSASPTLVRARQIISCGTSREDMSQLPVHRLSNEDYERMFRALRAEVVDSEARMVHRKAAIRVVERWLADIDIGPQIVRGEAKERIRSLPLMGHGVRRTKRGEELSLARTRFQTSAASNAPTSATADLAKWSKDDRILHPEDGKRLEQDQAQKMWSLFTGLEEDGYDSCQQRMAKSARIDHMFAMFDSLRKGDDACYSPALGHDRGIDSRRSVADMDTR